MRYYFFNGNEDVTFDTLAEATAAAKECGGIYKVRDTQGGEYHI
jgi:hypothetical protein